MKDLSSFSDFFAEFGELVTAPGQLTYAFLDTPDSVGSVGGFDVIAGAMFLKYATGSFDIEENSEVVVAGKRYKVRDVRAVDDGLLTVATIKAIL